MPWIEGLAMPSEVDRQIQRSAELLQRVSARQLHKRARAAGRRAKRAVKYAVVSVTAIIVATLGWAIISPIGLQGVLIAAMLILLALIASVMLSGERAVPVEALGRTGLLTLPAATERWLDAQRRLLPAPAMPIIDRIGTRLEALAPQLRDMNPQEPAAQEIRTLLADHLPQLVNGYGSIPPELRKAERNGRVPDRQLIDGLSLIEQEIGEMTESLARGDLDRLAIHGRYLELKYTETKEIR
ncbi:MAG TPA: hypothetical protein VF475_07390 [Sphingobium sp.]